MNKSLLTPSAVTKLVQKSQITLLSPVSSDLMPKVADSIKSEIKKPGYVSVLIVRHQ